MTAARRGLALVALAAVACGGPEGSREPAIAPGPTPRVGATETLEPNHEQLYPDVVSARATQEADGTWRFDVTLSSPYDSPARYADGWRVLAPDGTELGVRILTHDHANEQPFTRSLAGVSIPASITSVAIQGRDQVNGWGGATVEVALGGG